MKTKGIKKCVQRRKQIKVLPVSAFIFSQRVVAVPQTLAVDGNECT